MTTVAFDTATADTVVAATTAELVIAERFQGPGPEGRPRHGPALLALIEEVVDAAGGWEAVTRIGVGIGPGSFTGVRIGVATARALGQARGIAVCGVPTTAALAAGIPAGPDRSALAVIDARRGEVFASALLPDSARADAPMVLAPERLAGTIQGCAGALAAGDGAVRFRGELEAAGIEVLPDESPVHRISARHLGALAETVEAGALWEVKPLYLRRPDAERWREQDGRN